MEVTHARLRLLPLDHYATVHASVMTKKQQRLESCQRDLDANHPHRAREKGRGEPDNEAEE